MDSQQQAWDESQQPTVQGEFQAIFFTIKVGKSIDSPLWRGQSSLWGHHPKWPLTQPCVFLCSREQQGQGTFSLNTSRTRGSRSSGLHRLGLSFPGWEQAAEQPPNSRQGLLLCPHPSQGSHPSQGLQELGVHTTAPDQQNRSHHSPAHSHPRGMSRPCPAP